ncbi:MAG: LysE family translocator [Lentilitoribacter sp.]
MDQLFLVYITYFLGVASPGPANFAIMHTSLEQGRVSGMAFALGVFSVSVCFGISSAFGLGAIIVNAPVVYETMTLVGAIYLIYLGYNIARKVIDLKGNNVEPPANDNMPSKTLLTHYLRGILIHATNPKAITVWLTIILLATSGDGGKFISPYQIVVGCAILAFTSMMSYAVFFSSRPMVALYTRIRKPFTLTLAGVFVLAGLVMLFRAWAAFR